MGQASSMPSSRKRPIRRSFRSPFRRTSTQGSLSATFTYVEPSMKLNQLNINLATEEELMTLPGVSRGIARNIIDYRNAIGRFNKVEDLALVSGIGADRLDDIRPEICANKRKNHSCGSSTETSPEAPPIDINSANVFELMSVRGVSQELAANIIHFRERKGDFFSISDLLKVKGLSEIKLESLRPKICLKTDHSLRPLRKKTVSEPRLPNGSLDSYYARASPKERGDSTDGVGQKDVFELVSRLCKRPLPPTVWSPMASGQIRLAFWHLGDMCRKKAANMAVRETFALTILENRLTFVSLQGVQDGLSLHMLCSELNAPSCKKVAAWGSRGHWEPQFFSFKGEQGLGFIYNTNILRRVVSKTVQDNSMMRAAVATIAFRNSEVSVLNVELLQNSDGCCFSTLLSSVAPTILTADLSSIGASHPDKCSFMGYTCLFPGTLTNVKKSDKPFYDGIFIKESELSRYTGEWGEVTEGLTHLAIPDGWSWDGPVSRHHPIWIRLSL